MGFTGHSIGGGCGGCYTAYFSQNYWKLAYYAPMPQLPPVSDPDLSFFNMGMRIPFVSEYYYYNVWLAQGLYFAADMQRARESAMQTRANKVLLDLAILAARLNTVAMTFVVDAGHAGGLANVPVGAESMKGFSPTMTVNEAWDYLGSIGISMKFREFQNESGISGKVGDKLGLYWSFRKNVWINVDPSYFETSSSGALTGGVAHEIMELGFLHLVDREINPGLEMYRGMYGSASYDWFFYASRPYGFGDNPVHQQVRQWQTGVYGP